MLIRYVLLLVVVEAFLQEARSQAPYLGVGSFDSSHRARYDLYPDQFEALPLTRSPLPLPLDSLSLEKAWKPFNTATIVVQVPTGLVFGTAAGVSVVYLLFPRDLTLNNSGQGVLALTAGIVAVAVCVPGGVYFAGKWMGGNGTFSATLNWSGYGFLGGLVLGSVTKSGVVGGIVYLTGTIVGYHLSASSPTDAASITPTTPGLQYNGPLSLIIPPGSRARVNTFVNCILKSPIRDD